MSMIELPDEQLLALKAKASAQGLSLQAWSKKLAGEENTPRVKPLKSAYGLLAEFGPARLLLKRSTRTVVTCFAASAKISR